MKISSETKVNMVIGDPINHSLSPLIHNAGYEAIGIDSDFVYVACRVGINRLASFVEGIRAMNILGVSCTIPHKVWIMQYLDFIDEIAKKIGAVNTVVNDNSTLHGYNTDWLGVVGPIEKLTSLSGKAVAVVGAGGAARAAAYGVVQKNAKLTIFNRTVSKAEELATEFGGDALPLESLDEIKKMDVIFNATSVGLKTDDETPIPQDLIQPGQIVFDAIYTPLETRLLRESKLQGAITIHGLEMLLAQGAAQFELYTGHEAPLSVMRAVLENKLGKK